MNIDTLLNKFKETREWRKLSPNSQRTYQQMIDYAIKDYFLITNRVSQITTTLVDDLYEKLVKAGKLSHANMFMKVMRRIWNVSRRNKLVTDNPFASMGLGKEEPREIVWTKEQYEQYVEYTWKNDLQPLSLLARLCYTLGQRPGDMVKLKATNFTIDLNSRKPVEVKFTQEKTGKKMHLPIPEELQKYLVASTKPFPTMRILNGQHREVLAKLNLPYNLQIRDLRRTALTEIMTGGASDAEGQAVSGHVNRDMLSVYAPTNLNMAKSAMKARGFLK